MSRRAPRFADGSLLKQGSVVTSRWFVPGTPVGLSSDTRCVVLELNRSTGKVRVERDDGREGSWWLHLDAIEGFGRGLVQP